MAAAGLGLVEFKGFPAPNRMTRMVTAENGTPDIPFAPNRMVTWWSVLDDLQWPQKSVKDKIKRRAAAFAEAKIDTVINEGFHIRFDFANYFGQLHGYLADVCEELHRYGIKYMDHYSCNHIGRPRGEVEKQKLHRGQRHVVLLYHDPVAAKHAQYEGVFFNDICEIDVRDGSRGYSTGYQLEAFCHNHPEFLEMHRKYLLRLLNDVPMDGIEVDDMCDYAGLSTCGCKYCRDRLKQDYGHELPPLEDRSFWGDTSKDPRSWGNYENPAFRNWIRMKTDAIVDHLKMVKATVGEKPLMTCCSSGGPMLLNALSLDIEKMAPQLDFFMLENTGINIRCVNWIPRDAEALLQKDIARERGNVPSIAMTKTVYSQGGYFGWSLSRFWGVANWNCVLDKRLEETPDDAMEMEEVVYQPYNWAYKFSNLNHREGEDVAEVRLVNNRYCRENGWRDRQGAEHWSRVSAWSALLVKHNIGYRFLRADELSDANRLTENKTPLIMDGVGCVSDAQFDAICTYLSKKGCVWIALPFGTHDEKGFLRKIPLSESLLKKKYKTLTVVDSAISNDPLKGMILQKKFHPVIEQISGDPGWAVRARLHQGAPIIHFLNKTLIGRPHPKVKDNAGVPILTDIDSPITDNKLVYRINRQKLNLPQRLKVISPEWNEEKKDVTVSMLNNEYAQMHVHLDGIKIYAVILPDN
jgi:hypothetical protein